MKKLFGLAEILKVEIPENLADSNEENERLDVSLTFRFGADVEGADVLDREEFKDVDSDLLELAQAETSRSDYRYLFDALKVGYKADESGKAVKELKKKLEGKRLPFTVYVYQIHELLKGTKYINEDGQPYTSVHNERRGFSSFSNSYLLKYDDMEAVFSAMQSRLLKDLKDKALFVGRTDDDSDEFMKRLKKQRKAAEENED